MNARIKNNIKCAVDRAMKFCADGNAVWCPVFVDILSGNEKVAHLVSDGFIHETWTLFPVEELRSQQVSKWGEELRSGHRVIHNKPLNEVMPGWLADATFADAITYHEWDSTRSK